MGRWVVACLLMMTLAGCAEDAAPEAEGPQALDVDTVDTLGAISGVVVDPTITPIVGATISILNDERKTTTNENGQFTFTDLEPGFYALQASATGHDPIQVTADVKAGEVAKPKLVMPITVSKDPYHLTVQRHAANIISTPGVVVYPNPETILVNGPFQGLVLEGTWEGLIVSIDPEASIDTALSLDQDGWSHRFYTGQEMYVVLNGTGMPDAPTEFYWRSWPGFNTLSVDAFAELFFTFWYHQDPPEGWSIYEGDR